MRPLSVLTYYLRNKRKVVPLMAILTLAVALMVVVQSLVSSARDTAYAIYGSYSGVEVVAPRVKSQVDAYKPISEALDGLRQERGALAAGAAPAGGGLASLAVLLDELKSVPAQLQAKAPSTAALDGSLRAASAHGATLEGDLTRLSADLHRAAQQQSEQQKLASALQAAQAQPANLQPLLALLKQPGALTGLTRPDTTDYDAIAAEAGSAATDAAALVADLDAVRGHVATLHASAGSIKVPALTATLPRIPDATAELTNLDGRLRGLQSTLEQLSGAQGDIGAIETAARAIPGVARVERDNYANIDLNMLAGNANFDLYGMSDDGMRALIDFYGVTLAAGRMPRQDRPEVVLDEQVARARGVGIGGAVGSDVDELDSLPERFTVVGLLRGPVRLGLIPRSYMIDNYFFSRRYQALVVVPEPGRVAQVRAPLHRLIEKQPYRIFDGPFIEGKIDSLLANLQTIDNFLTLAVALTLALVIGLLNNLYFRQRMNEFGLLAALGYSRRRLAGKVVTEGSLVVVAAWILGAAAGSAALYYFDVSYMAPHGLVLRVFDPAILLRATLPVPVMVLLVSLGTLLLQLARLDPIAIIERRD